MRQEHIHDHILKNLKAGIVSILAIVYLLGPLGAVAPLAETSSISPEGPPPDPGISTPAGLHSLYDGGTETPATQVRPTPVPPPPTEQHEPGLPEWVEQLMAQAAPYASTDEFSLIKSADTGTGDLYNIDNGERVTYTVVLENQSTITNQVEITNVLVVDDLPNDTLEDIHCIGSPCWLINKTYTVPVPSGGRVAVTATRQISWFVPVLTPTTSITLVFRGRVVGQPEGKTFTNRAFATYYQDGEGGQVADSNPVELTAHIRLDVQGEATISPVPTWFSEDVGGTISQDWGDFDRDGDMDLALGSSIGATIYRNEGGQLEQIWEPESPQLSYGVRWADVVITDSQPYLELVVVGNSVDQSTIGEGINYIYRYDGEAFDEAAELTFPSDYQLVRLAPGDYDGDGDVDLVASTNAINAPCTVSLYRNDGAGHLTSTVTCLSGYATAAVAAADYDDDGDLDLALGAFPGTLQLLANRSNGHVLTATNPFSTATPIIVETYMDYIPYDLAWGDYDQDGYLDLAAAYPLQQEARIYRNQPTGGLDPIRPPLRTGPFMTPLAIDWGDFDGDGWLDLAVADSPPRIYRYAGEEGFKEWSNLDLPPSNGQVWSIRGVDLNNQSHLDLVLSNRDGPSWQLTAAAPHLRPGLSSVRPPLDNWRAGSVAWGDADGDGDLDLLFGSGPPPALLSYLYNNQNGAFTVIDPDGVFDSSGFGTHYVAFGDITGTGRLDVAIGTPAAVQVYSSDNTETPALELPADRRVRSLVWGDANDDSQLDLLVGYGADADGQGQVRLYLYQSEQSTMTLAFTTAVGGDVHSLAWGDYDGDYYPDFAVGVGNGPAQIYQSNGDTTFDLAWSSPDPLPTRAVAWADYDGDGDLDLAVGNGQGAEDQVWENDSGTFSHDPVWSSGHPLSRTTSLAWGDWNNDGYPELAIGRASEPDVVYANLGSAPGSPRLFALWTSIESQTTTGVAWGDRDGDGDLDLAISSSGQSGFYENTMMSPAHLPNTDAWTTLLPNNPTYLYVERPNSTSDAYFYSSPEILGGLFHPTMTIRYQMYDPEANPVAGTSFEYSLDGGSQWHTAEPAAGSPTPITQTSRSGQKGLFIWDAAADDAVSDNARFRVRVTQQNDVGPVQRATSGAVSPPFRVRGLDCFWPTKLSVTVSNDHVDLGEQVYFTGTVGSASGQLEARWSFGDGAESTGWKATHQYERHDVFKATLQVNGPACPIARPGYASVFVTSGLGHLPFDIYLPAVMRSHSAGTSAAAADTPIATREEVAPPWRSFQTERPAAVPPPPTTPATDPLTALADAQSSSGTTAPGVNTIRVSRSHTGFEGQPAVADVNPSVTRVAFWSTGDLGQDGENRNPDGNIEIFLAEVNSTGRVRYTQVTSSAGSILGGFNLAPSISDDGNVIAFFSDGDYKVHNQDHDNKDHNFEIFLFEIGPRGNITFTQVTDSRRTVNILPSVTTAGDDTYIAFISDDNLDSDKDNGDGNQEIFLARTSFSGIKFTQAFTQVTNTTDTINDQPAAAANGADIYIAFASDGDLTGGNADRNQEIFLAQLSAGSVFTPVITQVTSTTDTVGINAQPDISADGSRIVFVSDGDLDPIGDNSDGNQEVFLARISTDTITITQITKSGSGIENDQPTISGDGRRVAYVRIESATERQLGIYDFDAEKTVSLGTRSDIIRPALTADASGIAFVSNWDIFLAYPPDVDLSANKTATPGTVQTGEKLTYTFAISNVLSTPATGAWITDVLPVGVQVSFAAGRPDYTDDDNSTSGFGGGDTDHGTRWEPESQLLILDTPSFLELPNGGGITEPWNDWTGMTGNVLLLHLNEPVSATTLADTSGRDNDGTCYGAACPSSVSGQLGSAKQFDGAESYVMITDTADLDFGPGESFAVSLWVKADSTQVDTTYGDNSILEKWSASGPYPYVVRYLNQNTTVNSGKITVARYDGTYHPGVSSSRRINDGEFHHIVFVKDHTTDKLYLYLDGTLEGTSEDTTTGSTANSSHLYLGRRGNGSNRFRGEIDEVAVYGRALDAQEVLSIYERQAPKNTAYFDSRPMAETPGTFGWNSITMVSPRPLGVPLPDYGALEGNYLTGTVDMLDNVLLLHLDEPVDSTAFVDTSGQGNNGSCAGVSCPKAGVDGRFGTALDFNGTDHFVDTADFDIGNDFTALLWANPDTTDNGQSLIGKHTAGGDNLFLFGFWEDGYYVNVRDQTFTTGTVRTGWQHLAVVGKQIGSATKVTIFQDGTELGHTTLGTLLGDVAGKPWTIGQDWDGAIRTDLFGGRIDEVAIFDQALSAATVRDHYLRGALRVRFQARACDNQLCAPKPFVGPDGDRSTYYPARRVEFPLEGSEDFESGYSDWTMNGLWEAESESDTCGSRVAPFPSSSHAAYYGQSGICNYDTGGTNSGVLTKIGPITLQGNVAYLTFWSYEDTECRYGNCYFDRRHVDISTNDGASWVTVWGSTGPERSWYEATVDLSAYTGESVRIRFHFDTVDGLYNHYFGWMVDDIRIRSGVGPTFQRDLSDIFPPTFLLETTDQPYFQYRVFLETDVETHQPALNSVTVNPRVSCVGSEAIACYLDPYAPLAPYGSVTWTVTTDVADEVYAGASQQGNQLVITNTAEVIGVGFETNTANDIGSVATTLKTSHLVITKTASSDPIAAGLSLTYYLTVTNLGEGTAKNIQLVDMLPAEMYFDHVGPSQCGHSDGTVTCNWTRLDDGASKVVTIKVSVPSTFTGIITNTAVVSSTTPTFSADRTVVTTTVFAAADLRVTKTHQPDLVVAGDPLTYTIAVTNTGPSIARNVVLTDTVPPSVIVTSIEPDVPICVENGGTVSCNWDQLDAGDSATVTIKVSVPSPLTGVITNTAVVASTTYDPDPLNNRAETVDQVRQKNPVPTLTAIDPYTATRGGPSFTLVVTGTNFVTDAIVRWDGEYTTTTLINSTRLTATIPASFIDIPGTFTVIVFNPSPGGGESNGLPFTVTVSSLSPGGGESNGLPFVVGNPGSTLAAMAPVAVAGVGPTLALTVTNANVRGAHHHYPRYDHLIMTVRRRLGMSPRLVARSWR